MSGTVCSHQPAQAARLTLGAPERSAHDAAETIAGRQTAPDGPGSLEALRHGVLAGVGVIVLMTLFLTAYLGAFAKPEPHGIPMSLVASVPLAQALERSPALKVHPSPGAAEARRLVEDRAVYGALIVQRDGRIQVDVANGAGHSVALVLADMASTLAERTGARLTVEDLAPLSPQDPNGVVEFYGIVFLTIASSIGAGVFGRAIGAVRDLRHAAERVVFLTLYTALLSAVFVTVADAGFGALSADPGSLFLVFWAYATAVCLAITGVAARLGSAASLLVTLAMVILGNTSAGGPVARPLLNSFFSALTYVFPQGAGLSMVRGALYFGGRGLSTGAPRWLCGMVSGCSYCWEPRSVRAVPVLRPRAGT